VIARYPSNHNNNRGAWIAKLCENRAALRKYLAHISNQVDESVWSANDLATATVWAQ
jgi:hypothetical protein